MRRPSAARSIVARASSTSGSSGTRPVCRPRPTAELSDADVARATPAPDNSAELERDTGPPVPAQLEPRGDRPGAVPVPHVHADLGAAGLRLAHVHAADLRPHGAPALGCSRRAGE